jgi:hypothetical protein
VRPCRSKPAQPFDLRLDEVFRRDRLLALLQDRHLVGGELLAVEIVAGLLGFGAGVGARLLVGLELLDVAEIIVSQSRYPL